MSQPSCMVVLGVELQPCKGSSLDECKRHAAIYALTHDTYVSFKHNDNVYECCPGELMSCVTKRLEES